VNLSIVACAGFTDDGFKVLSNLKFLSSINMYWNSYNPYLANNTLQSLLLGKNNVTIKSVRVLLKNCPSLQTLDLSACSQLGNAAELIPNIVPQLKLRFVGLEKVPFNLTEKLTKEVKQVSLALIGRKITILSDTITTEDDEKLRDFGFNVQKSDNSTVNTPIA
jgi:hypothetical protein